LIIDTRNWWPGKRVIVSCESVERVSWNEGKAYLSLAREAIREAPEYDSIQRVFDESALGRTSVRSDERRSPRA
jgi:hypothetical protein